MEELLQPPLLAEEDRPVTLINLNQARNSKDTKLASISAEEYWHPDKSDEIVRGFEGHEGSLSLPRKSTLIKYPDDLSLSESENDSLMGFSDNQNGKSVEELSIGQGFVDAFKVPAEIAEKESYKSVLSQPTNLEDPPQIIKASPKRSFGQDLLTNNMHSQKKFSALIQNHKPQIPSQDSFYTRGKRSARSVSRARDRKASGEATLKQVKEVVLKRDLEFTKESTELVLERNLTGSSCCRSVLERDLKVTQRSPSSHGPVSKRDLEFTKESASSHGLVLECDLKVIQLSSLSPASVSERNLEKTRQSSPSHGPVLERDLESTKQSTSNYGHRLSVHGGKASSRSPGHHPAQRLYTDAVQNMTSEWNNSLSKKKLLARVPVPTKSLELEEQREGATNYKESLNFFLSLETPENPRPSKEQLLILKPDLLKITPLRANPIPPKDQLPISKQDFPKITPLRTILAPFPSNSSSLQSTIKSLASPLTYEIIDCNTSSLQSCEQSSSTNFKETKPKFSTSDLLTKSQRLRWDIINSASSKVESSKGRDGLNPHSVKKTIAVGPIYQNAMTYNEEIRNSVDVDSIHPMDDTGSDDACDHHQAIQIIRISTSSSTTIPSDRSQSSPKSKTTTGSTGCFTNRSPAFKKIFAISIFVAILFIAGLTVIILLVALPKKHASANQLNDTSPLAVYL